MLTYLKSWYLLGPVTRFHQVGEEVKYEVAQVALTACRMSDESHDISVRNEETVSMDSGKITRDNLTIN